MISRNALFVLVFIGCCTSASLAIYQDCGSLDGAIEGLEVSKCAATARRCILRRNTNATMTIKFKTNTDSDSLKAVVHGMIMGMPVPFSLPNPNGCKDSGVDCPIHAGNSYQYVTSMPILSSYPRVTVDIKWEIQDAQGRDIICAMIPAKIA
ncbi:hypothetical protein HUJ04_009631 [Dendroctonus ponderosae]|uniref:MD-2-related lipid-recognition domain-containing protein n=1 Tax=Dendroctonus ponderosae TaxID=77166 RepID=J3JU13_DENPD